MVLGLCSVVVAFLMLLTENFGTEQLTEGLKLFALISGISLILAFYFNKRSRIRPSWSLPFGLILIVISLGYFLCDIVPGFEKPSFGLSLITEALAIFDGVLLISCGLHLRELTMKRRFMHYTFSLLCFVFVILSYGDYFSLRSNEISCCGVFLIIFGAEAIGEGISDMVREKIRRTKNYNGN